MNKFTKILSCLILSFCGCTVHSELSSNNPEAEIRISTMGGKTKIPIIVNKRIVDLFPNLTD